MIHKLPVSEDVEFVEVDDLVDIDDLPEGEDEEAEPDWDPPLLD